MSFRSIIFNSNYKKIAHIYFSSKMQTGLEIFFAL